MKIKIYGVLIVFATSLLLLQNCGGDDPPEPAEKINLTIKIVDYTPDLTINTQINSGPHRRAIIKNGRFELKDLKKRDKLFIEVKKPGHTVDILSPRNPLTIVRTQTISLDMRISKNERMVSFWTNPSREGVKIFGSSGVNVELLTTTDGNGVANYMISEDIWSKIKFSFDYSMENKRGVASNSAEYSYNSLPESPIQINLFPESPYTSKLKVVDGTNQEVLENCEIGIKGIGKIARTNSKGIAEILVSSEDFINADLRLDDLFGLDVNKRGYEEKTIEVKVSELLQSEEQTPVTVNLMPYLALSIIVKDKKGNPMPDVDINVEGHRAKTNTQGIFKLKYSTGKEGEIVSISFMKQYYLTGQMEHKLLLKNHAINVSMQSISQEVNVRDTASETVIRGINFISDSRIDIKPLENGNYAIYFTENNKNYLIKIRDQKGLYEEKEERFYINNNTLGQVKQINLPKKTSLTVQVNDAEGNPVRNVNILEGNKIVGKTRADGSATINYSYTSTPMKLLFKKSKYNKEDRQITLNPGSNTLTVILNELMMNIQIVDKETNILIPNVNITINGTTLNTGSEGKIKYRPELTPSTINYSFGSNDGKYLAKKGQLTYSYGKSAYQVKLSPQPVIIITTVFEDPFGNEGIVSGARIEMDGHFIGQTNNFGESTYKLSALPQQHTFQAFKEGFAAKPVRVAPNSNTTIQVVKIKMDMIAASFTVSNLQGDRLSGIEIIVNNVRRKTNSSGHAIVQLTELKTPLDIQFRDPAGVYENVTLQKSFQESGERVKQLLLAKPTELTVNVRWAFAPAIGIIEIDPIPDPIGKKNRYTLVGGKATVNIYRPDTYSVKYITTVSPIVSGVQDVEINLTNREQYLDIEIPAAQMKVLVDTKYVINVDVFRIDAIRSDSDGYVGSVVGDGVAGLDVSASGYGEYRFVFKRDGWNNQSIKDAMLNTPNQLIDFSIGDAFSDCKSAYFQGNWEDACVECKKITEGDPDYCSSLIQLSKIYEEELSNPRLAAKYLYDYVKNMEGECEKAYHHYEDMFRVLKSVEIIPSELDEGDNLRELFDEYLLTITYTLSNSQIKNQHIMQSKKDLCFISNTRIRALKVQSAALERGESIERQNIKARAQKIKEELMNVYSRGLTNSQKQGYLKTANSILNGMK
jgi:hypothetical protein